MNLDFRTLYHEIDSIVKGNTLDLSRVEFIHPWSIVMICLLLIERTGFSNKSLILPENEEVKSYLKRMHFDQLLLKLGYKNEGQILEKILIPENDNLGVQEIWHCLYRDEFNARLERFISMFLKFGLNKEDAYRAMSVVGELGNNVFDHNSGSWPLNISGCIIAAQNYPKKKSIQFVIGDPGVGFKGSLKSAYPEINNDIEAIKKGLAGHTGRVGEKRGNGLRLIQEWTINNFSGKVMIHSGDGLVIVDKNGSKSYKVNRILGSLAQFVINYNY